MASNDKEKCPYCGTECYADWVDVGIGEAQCGPYYCENCGASEIGSYDNIGFDRKIYHNWFNENYKFEKQDSGKFKYVFIGSGEKDFKIPNSATITQDEWEKGWFSPGAPMGSSVNTCDGIYVDHKTAKKLYDNGLLDEKED
jgi:hypothetical protein